MPIFSEGGVIGTMNIYSRDADAFDDEHEAMSAIIATAAGSAIEKSRLLADVHAVRDRLQVEFDDAAVINWARGVLMGFEQCSAEQADALLDHAAQTTPEALVEVAKRVCASPRVNPARRTTRLATERQCSPPSAAVLVHDGRQPSRSRRGSC